MSKKDNLGNVLIRSDLNVPIVNGKISDNYRIYKSLENLNNILERSKTVTFASHMGRPKGKDLNLSLKPVAEIMTEIIGNKVHFIKEIYGDEVKGQFNNSDTKIFLLENLRFDQGETNNDEDFAKKVTNPFNTYIFDAFGAAHRPHASVVSFGDYLEAYQGQIGRAHVRTPVTEKSRMPSSA